MTSRRLLLISKNFWPISGETELLASAFAKQLADLGNSVDILTWRMVRQWPDQFQVDRCNVIRLPQNQRSGWSPSALGYYGRNRWHRSLHRWINANKVNYDAVIILESADDSLLPTTMVGRSGLPTISRVRREHVFPVTRQMSRDLPAVLAKATCFVTPDYDLVANPDLGESPVAKRLVEVPDGWPSVDDAVDMKSARKILERVHPILKVDSEALLAVCGADLTFESGVFSLVRAWRGVLASFPDSRLWLIGTGTNSTELFQRICDLDMQHSVLLPGTFDEIRDVLAAANAYIMPGADDRAGWHSMMAMQLGLTVVHHQNAPVSQVFDHTHRRIPFDDGSRSLDLVLGRWATATRTEPQEQETSPGMNPERDAGLPDLTAMVRRYVELIECLESEPTSIRSTPARSRS